MARAVSPAQWRKQCAMQNRLWRVFNCSGILRHSGCHCSLSYLLWKFLPYSNLSIFLLLPRFIKDLTLLRMHLGIECCWHFRGNFWAVERFPGKQRLRSWTEDRSGKSEKASLVAISQWVLSFPWPCTAVWSTHSQLWNLSYSEFDLLRLWTDEKNRRKHSLLASQKPLLVLAEVSKDCYLKLGIFK